MKALSKLKAEEGIWMTDVPVPELGHNDLLIKIRKMSGRKKPSRCRWSWAMNMSVKW